MRKLVLLWLGVWVCSSVSYAVWDYTIVDGQYKGSVRLEGQESLLMTGGGAYRIEAFDASYVEIQNTAPYQVNVGGIADLNLHHSSRLLFTGGEIVGIDITGNAQVTLRGGRIDYLLTRQYVPIINNIAYPNIKMYVSEYNYNESTRKLAGLWWDDTTFDIQLEDVPQYDKTIDNIEFIVPEPVTLLLFGFGGLGICRFNKRRVVK